MPIKDRDENRKFQREWNAGRKAEFFADKSCVAVLPSGQVCGSMERLELDHIDPKDKTSHKIWSWSKKRRDAEIAKCQVLCHDCHKQKSAEYCRSLWAVHGTNSRYKAGCRCEPCVDAFRAHKRDCYHRRKQRQYELSKAA